MTQKTCISTVWCHGVSTLSTVVIISAAAVAAYVRETGVSRLDNGHDIFQKAHLQEPSQKRPILQRKG